MQKIILYYGILTSRFWSLLNLRVDRVSPNHDAVESFQDQNMWSNFIV